MKQSLALSYAMKKKKMAGGGDVQNSMDDVHQSGGKVDLENGQRMSERRKKLDDEFDDSELGPASEPVDVLGEYAKGGKVKSRRERAMAKFAMGGMVDEEAEYDPKQEPMRKHNSRSAMEDDRMLNQHGEYEEGAEGTMDDNEMEPDIHDPHAVENQDEKEDMVGRIMKQRAQHYSKGGRVANEDHGPKDSRLADFSPNEFDDLALRDDLEDSYTGANSGDELSDEREDEDRKDIVARIMKSRAKKDRNPSPA